MKPTHKRCRCGACGEYFGRVSTFDKHRTGPYSERRCMTADEMKAAGLCQDSNGVWKRYSGWRSRPKQTTSLETNTDGRVGVEVSQNHEAA